MLGCSIFLLIIVVGHAVGALILCRAFPADQWVNGRHVVPEPVHFDPITYDGPHFDWPDPLAEDFSLPFTLAELLGSEPIISPKTDLTNNTVWVRSIDGDRVYQFCAN